ncbi:MAG TPA: Crp/Fnr family transcriptional regulator [Allosphingosinicella sp.]
MFQAPALRPECAGELSPLVVKLQTVTDLPADDIAALNAVCRDARELGPRRNIIREGDRPDHVHLIVEGWAARYKLLPDGARQITAFLLPGDLCDLHVTILGEMDHSISTIGRATVAFIRRSEMEALAARPGIARAFWWATLVDEAVLRAWIVNVGRRDAYEAIGHLMCELYVRLHNVGLAMDFQYELPLTQEEIADALGLTPVHVNRVLQRMRSEGLITLQRTALEILDYRRLEKAAGFNANYLHIEERV